MGNSEFSEKKNGGICRLGDQVLTTGCPVNFQDFRMLENHLEVVRPITLIMDYKL
jgi:hypothetical protein